MSEYLRDSGHHTMRTCDGCNGAFHCATPDDYDPAGDDDAPDWMCETCINRDGEIARLRAAMVHVMDDCELVAASECPQGVRFLARNVAKRLKTALEKK